MLRVAFGQKILAVAATSFWQNVWKALEAIWPERSARIFCQNGWIVAEQHYTCEITTQS